jgi:hypothetical protein
MSKLYGMVTLIVNVACSWGKTRVSYTELGKQQQEGGEEDDDVFEDDVCHSLNVSPFFDMSSVCFVAVLLLFCCWLCPWRACIWHWRWI